MTYNAEAAGRAWRILDLLSASEQVLGSELAAIDPLLIESADYLANAGEILRGRNAAGQVWYKLPWTEEAENEYLEVFEEDELPETDIFTERDERPGFLMYDSCPGWIRP